MRKLFSPLGLQYSVKKFLEDSTGIETDIRYDGMKVAKKPRLVVTILPSTTYQISKGKEAVQTKHALQVDVYGRTKREVSDMHWMLSDLLTFGEFVYHTDNGEETDLVLAFDDEIIESPIFSDEYAEESKHHSMHFGVSVFIVRHKRLL